MTRKLLQRRTVLRTPITMRMVPNRQQVDFLRSCLAGNHLYSSPQWKPGCSMIEQALAAMGLARAAASMAAAVQTAARA